jgi:hypothetical protein
MTPEELEAEVKRLAEGGSEQETVWMSPDSSGMLAADAGFNDIPSGLPPIVVHRLPPSKKPRKKKRD